MIRKLRRKFILIAMLSITIVWAFLIGSINVFSYRSVVQNADMILEMLVSNQGSFPDRMPQRSRQPSDSDSDFDFPDVMRRGRTQISAETRFETRFFTVFFDKNGDAVRTDMGRIAAVDSSEAISLAEAVYKSGKTQGFSGGYRYRTGEADDTVFVVFYDCGRSLDNARSFLWISVTISVIGLLVVYALIAISSKFVIKPAAEAYEKQKRFITDAGHELKTPLAVINADCDVLEMESEDEDNEWLADIRKQTERLAELTNSLIYLAKTEEGAKNSIVKISFPLSDVVSEEIDSFRGLAKSSEKTIDTSITPDITFDGDQRAIRRLASILMDNAIKYSPDGGTVKAVLAKNGSKITFAVTNSTSAPISKEDKKRMFDRFYRTDESRNSETGGYGIGLSVAKAIVETHGGKIFAAGNGNEITITAEL